MNFSITFLHQTLLISCGKNLNPYAPDVCLSYQQKQAGAPTLNLGYSPILGEETASLQHCEVIKLYTQMAGLQKHQKEVRIQQKSCTAYQKYIFFYSNSINALQCPAHLITCTL